MGYVVRLRPSNDQRRVYLKLTGEGEKLHRTTCDQVDARYDVIESVLSKDKLKQLQSLLGELSAIGQHID